MARVFIKLYYIVQYLYQTIDFIAETHIAGNRNHFKYMSQQSQWQTQTVSFSLECFEGLPEGVLSW